MGGTQVCLSQEKHQETSILLTSIYNKTYIKIIFSAKQLAYAISPAHRKKKIKIKNKIPYFRIANVAGIYYTQ